MSCRYPRLLLLLRSNLRIVVLFNCFLVAGIVTTLLLTDRLTLGHLAWDIREERGNPQDVDTMLQNDLRSAVAECMTKSLPSLKVTDEARFGDPPVPEVLTCVRSAITEAQRNSFLRGPVLFPYKHIFTQNAEDACARQEVEVLFVIPSAPDNFKRREIVRQTKDHAEYVRDPINKAKLLFFLGRPAVNESEVQARIDDESKQFGDIVQSDFLDIHRNSRLKFISMLKWASFFCGNARFVIRLDDDVTVFTSKLVEVMRERMTRYDHFVIGRLKVDICPMRNKAKKDYLSRKEYPKERFPPHVLGGLVGFPTVTVKALFHAALRYPPIWIDDVFITGLCTDRLGIPVLGDKDFIFQDGHEKSFH